mmetsp:Transcript_43138/g.91788  ORF Transcript_43138/g.91788 Transcript_43138/m.91788 type:complete len:242 (+) Transcript_43138:1443-2168(+)
MQSRHAPLLRLLGREANLKQSRQPVLGEGDRALGRVDPGLEHLEFPPLVAASLGRRSGGGHFGGAVSAGAGLVRGVVRSVSAEDAFGAGLGAGDGLINQGSKVRGLEEKTGERRGIIANADDVPVDGEGANLRCIVGLSRRPGSGHALVGGSPLPLALLFFLQEFQQLSQIPDSVQQTLPGGRLVRQNQLQVLPGVLRRLPGLGPHVLQQVHVAVILVDDQDLAIGLYHQREVGVFDMLPH